MGLFDFFGGKKAAQEQEASEQRSAAEKKEKDMQSSARRRFPFPREYDIICGLGRPVRPGNSLEVTPE